MPSCEECKHWQSDGSVIMESGVWLGTCLRGICAQGLSMDEPGPYTNMHFGCTWFKGNECWEHEREVQKRVLQEAE